MRTVYWWLVFGIKGEDESDEEDDGASSGAESKEGDIKDGGRIDDTEGKSRE